MLQSSNAEDWVDEHADVMYRYAVARVGRTHVAEDLVQDALLAALKARDTYQGRASLRTWLFGILRHKILDHLLACRRANPSGTGDADAAAVEGWFDEQGRWLRPPNSWSLDPAAQAENQELWEVFRGCLCGVSPGGREIFARRVMDHESCESICEDLELSPANLWVILHRARAILRACVEMRWFGKDARQHADPIRPALE